VPEGTAPERRLRIVLAVFRFPVASETFIVAHAVGLLERGHDVHILKISPRPGDWETVEPEHRQLLDGRVHQWTLRPPQLAAVLTGAPARALRRDRRAAAAIVRAAARGSPLPFPARLLVGWWLVGLAGDVVHAEFGDVGRVLAPLRPALGAPLVVSLRGFDILELDRDAPGAYDSVWRWADGVHVLGADLERAAAARGMPSGLLRRRIPPAVDPGRFDPAPTRPGRLGTAAEPLRVLSVGRLVAKKDHPTALRTVAETRRRGISVVHRILGSGPEEEDLAAEAARLGLADVVELAGHVPHQEVGDHLAWADVLLHTAASEGFGNAVLEAQAAGVPVVCTDAEGLTENVAEGESGLVGARGDVAALAEHLCRLAGDERLRRRLAAAGPVRARSFGRSRQLDAFERLYRDVVREARRRGHPPPGSG
jgi:colanic acid/amylovoran biosynthesis glycosyltransferase